MIPGVSGKTLQVTITILTISISLEQLEEIMVMRVRLTTVQREEKTMSDG